jgi:hypothetical protein
MFELRHNNFIGDLITPFRKLDPQQKSSNFIHTFSSTGSIEYFPNRLFDIKPVFLSGA